MDLCFDWVSEVEWTHIDRLRELLPGSRFLRKNVFKHSHQLLQTRYNPIQNYTSIEVLKYITRVFHVPYACYDISWILFHPAFQSILSHQSHVRLRITATPKVLEIGIQNALFYSDNVTAKSSYQLPDTLLHPTQFTHILCVVYSYEHSLFRWGIVDRAFFESQAMSSTAITASLASTYSLQESVAPVSRAYFKMSEIVAHYLPSLGWMHSRVGAGIDVGASPGGWSQVLATLCKHVLAIDPGVLLFSSPHVQHLPHVAQAPQVQTAIAALAAPVTYIVCDMNMDGRECAMILTTHILPHVRALDEAILVLTLKCVKNPSAAYIARISATIEALFVDMQDLRCSEPHVIHLTANSKNERTLLCKVARREGP